jgi:hypothetical protein
MTLPFIEDSKWPISKEAEERVANPGYDTQIEEHLMDELMKALEHKDIGNLRESIVALIEHLKSSEE